MVSAPTPTRADATDDDDRAREAVLGHPGPRASEKETAEEPLGRGAARGVARPDGPAGRRIIGFRPVRGRLLAGLVTVLVVAALVVAVVVMRVSADRDMAAVAPSVAASQVTAAQRSAAARIAHGGTSSFQNPHPSAAPVSTTATPTRVTVPSIEVDAALQSLATVKGVLQPPTNFTDAGWYTAGVRPGNIGPAVIAGHFDAAVGPAVFDKLRLVRPGAEIDVARSDGTTARFRVTRSAFVSKALFPSTAVYGPTPDAQLRLITCGGTYDQTVGHYDDNLVVFATLITPPPH